MQEKDEICRLVVHCPPAAKARPRFGGGHAFMPKKYRDWQKAFTAEAKPQYVGEPIATTIAVHIVVRTKSGSMRPDADNMIGAVLDACQGWLFVNDRQVHELFACVISGEPSIEIKVYHA